MMPQSGMYTDTACWYVLLGSLRAGNNHVLSLESRLLQGWSSHFSKYRFEPKWAVLIRAYAWCRVLLPVVRTFLSQEVGMERYHGGEGWQERSGFLVSLVTGSCSPGPLSWQKRTAGSVEAGAAAPLDTPLALTQHSPVVAGKVAVVSLFAAGINGSLVARSDHSGPCSLSLGMGLFSCGQILLVSKSYIFGCLYSCVIYPPLKWLRSSSVPGWWWVCSPLSCMGLKYPLHSVFSATAGTVV